MNRIDAKTMLIRLVGALCIIGSVVMLFLSPWVQLDGLKRKEKSAVTDVLSEVYDGVEEGAVTLVEDIDEISKALKKADLPYKEKAVKTMVRGITDPLKAVFDEGVSLQGIFSLSWAFPEVAEWMGVTMDVMLDNAAAIGPAEEVTEVLEDIQDALETPVSIVRVVVIVFLALAVLTLLSAVCHMCNRVRWVKYLLLVLVMALVIGSYVAVPIASDSMNDAIEDAVDSLQESLNLPAEVMAAVLTLENLELTMGLMPALGAVLLLVPVLLDIIFEGKRKRTPVRTVRHDEFE